MATQQVSRYEGERNQKGAKNGKGTMIYADGCTYTGEWTEDKQEGEGVFDWGDGNKYIGHFKSGKQEGYGVYCWPTGGKYEGFWRNDRMNGFGKYRRNDGVMFIGEWRDDHQYGLGHRIQPERYWVGPSKNMERKRIVREIWNSNKELVFSKDLLWYPDFAPVVKQRAFFDIRIYFGGNEPSVKAISAKKIPALGPVPTKKLPTLTLPSTLSLQKSLPPMSLNPSAATTSSSVNSTSSAALVFPDNKNNAQAAGSSKRLISSQVSNGVFTTTSSVSFASTSSASNEAEDVEMPDNSGMPQKKKRRTGIAPSPSGTSSPN